MPNRPNHNDRSLNERDVSGRIGLRSSTGTAAMDNCIFAWRRAAWATTATPASAAIHRFVI